MKRAGIDVSEWQDSINWSKVKKSGIDFAMVRLGFGTTAFDKQAENNIKGCSDNNIGLGGYWFLYAGDVETAKANAKMCIDILSQHKGEFNYPIACDFEGDCINWYRNTYGKSMTPELAKRLVYAFCETLEQYGYYASLYTNCNCLSNYLGESIRSRFDLWLAQWNVTGPAYSVNMWQYSSGGSVDGISGSVDLNYCYKDYPTLFAEGGYNHIAKTEAYNMGDNIKFLTPQVAGRVLVDEGENVLTICRVKKNELTKL